MEQRKRLFHLFVNFFRLAKVVAAGLGERLLIEKWSLESAH